MSQQETLVSSPIPHHTLFQHFLTPSAIPATTPVCALNVTLKPASKAEPPFADDTALIGMGEFELRSMSSHLKLITGTVFLRKKLTSGLEALLDSVRTAEG